MARDTFYITTPIYYPSDRLHIGHAYTTTAADAVARWHRFTGKKVFFLTGSDEHGQKIERAAREKGREPKEYVDEIVATFQELWKRLRISYDDFIRTTEERHVRVVQEVFRRLYEKGDIYKGAYEGWYCTPCETFWRESKLLEGRLCPDCQREVEWVREESYFFRMSKYADRLLQYIEANPQFIQPDTRRNEMVSFIKSGLEDLCVSRTTFKWGIPVPFDEDHVIYVWIDALTNYITGVGFLQDQEKFETFWPADVHLVGKDILRFHTVIWPIILMALDLPLPKQVYGHGWLLVETGKMSKSKKNVVDPHQLMDEFGVDAIRYFLLREVPFGQDAKFSRRALIDRINADLANDLGNLLHRSTAMLHRYFDGTVPEPAGQLTPLEQELQDLAQRVTAAVGQAIERMELNQALVEIWQLIGRGNKYIDETEPWALMRQGNRERLATVMYHVFELQRIVALLIQPFMPETAEKIWQQLGIAEPLSQQRLPDTAWGGLRPGVRVRQGEPLFPRILEEDDDVAEARQETEEVAASRQPEGSVQQATSSAASQGGQSQAPATPVAGDAAAKPPSAPDSKPEITIDEFARLDLRVATVLSAEPVEGADKLLKLQVDLGGERRQVVAGIRKHYSPEQLVGRQVVIVANLKPAKLRGEVSQGMILAAVSPDGQLGVVSPDKPLPSGSQVR